MTNLNIAIIGQGRIGKLHAHNIINHLPQLKLKLMADVKPDRTWSNEHYIDVTNDVNDILDNNDIHAVLICSPSELHTSQIIECALKGKHVFCEKPIGLNEKCITQALDIVENNNIVLQTGFNRRFDPTFHQLKESVSQGEIDQPHMIRITSRDPEKPSAEYIKKSGGIFMDMSIHDIDMARYIMGQEVSEVLAFGNVFIDDSFTKLNDFDTALIHLKFANDSLGIIDNARQTTYGYDQRIEVFSNTGSIKANNIYENHICSYNHSGISFAKPQYFFLERYQQAFINQLKHFHQRITMNVSPIATGYDGLQALKIAKACKESALMNKPVKVSS